jgi:DNA-binding XRE family transcriptional regulator
MGEESNTKVQAKRVKMLREYFCLTETELARRLRVSQAVVAAIETGQISMSEKIMHDICFVLGCNYQKKGSGGAPS